MGADYSFDVKNIDIWVPAFFKHNNSFIATMNCQGHVLLEATDYYYVFSLLAEMTVLEHELR